jgi:hypothetical protein
MYFLQIGGQVCEGFDEEGVDESDGVEIVEFVVAYAFFCTGELFEEGGEEVGVGNDALLEHCRC